MRRRVSPANNGGQIVSSGGCAPGASNAPRIECGGCLRGPSGSRGRPSAAAGPQGTQSPQGDPVYQPYSLPPDRDIATDRSTQALSRARQSSSGDLSHISGPALAFGQGMRWLVGRLRRDGHPTGFTEAVLAAVPAVEDLITAEAGGGPRIRRGGSELLSSVSRALTHSGPQRCTVAV